MLFLIDLLINSRSHCFPPSLLFEEKFVDSSPSLMPHRNWYQEKCLEPFQPFQVSCESNYNFVINSLPTFDLMRLHKVSSVFKLNSVFSCTATELPSPSSFKLGRRGSTFSSMRLSQKASSSHQVRRNTTRVRGRSYKEKKVNNVVCISSKGENEYSI